MTQEEQQPPVAPEGSTDSGGGVTQTTTQTEEDARRTAQLAEIANTKYKMPDHITYSQMIYEQPSWVIESVFASGQLDSTLEYTPGEVQAALDTMMASPDNRYETTPPPPEGQ